MATPDEMMNTTNTMIANFASIFCVVAGCSFFLVRKADAERLTVLDAMTCTYEPKRLTEKFWLSWAVCWVLSFGIIIGFRMYEWFDAAHYMIVCGGLSAPLLIQPILFPGVTGEELTPWTMRHCVKANVWIAIFSFIGNWWYTHYFYSVLKASYSMPSYDVNAVPIAMFFATHFYFTLYHALASKVLRWVKRCYCPGLGRTLFSASLVLAMAYSTAFTESLTISAYPCYSFQNIHQAYTVGSAFYGIYFIVSYPLFATLDEPDGKPISSLSSLSPNAYNKPVDASRSTSHLHSLKSTILEVFGGSMIVLMLLDIVRVYLEIELVVPLQRPCKFDSSLTCAPFTGNYC